MVAPEFTQSEKLTRETYLVLMQALSRPGVEHVFPRYSDPKGQECLHCFLRIAETLLDPETLFYSDLPVFCERVQGRFGTSVAPEEAEYLFLGAPDSMDLARIRHAAIGNDLFPDQSATFLIWENPGPTSQFYLRGPGIEESVRVESQGVPISFWELRNEKVRYPLGWDLFLVNGSIVRGIPRSSELRIVR